MKQASHLEFFQYAGRFFVLKQFDTYESAPNSDRIMVVRNPR